MRWRANGIPMIHNVITSYSAVVTVSKAGGGVAMAVLYSSSLRLRAPFDLGDGGRSRQDCVSLDLDLYI